MGLINVFSSQPLSELTGKQIAARADEDDGGKEDDNENADDSEDGPITCKASAPPRMDSFSIFIPYLQGWRRRTKDFPSICNYPSTFHRWSPLTFATSWRAAPCGRWGTGGRCASSGCIDGGGARPTRTRNWRRRRRRRRAPSHYPN